MNHRCTGLSASAGWNHRRASFPWAEVAAQLHPNWGWAIVVLTLVINMLAPFRCAFELQDNLEISAWRRKSKHPGKKYKKYSMRDPRKAE